MHFQLAAADVPSVKPNTRWTASMRVWMEGSTMTFVKSGVRVRILIAAMMATLGLGIGTAAAQSTVDVGLLGPFSGPWAEHGKLMRIGAEMAAEEINGQGGIKALGGAKINLVI